jgi:hypothetical protein
MEQRWQNIQSERNLGFPPIIDPTQFAGPQCSGLRIRKEVNSRDYMNSRMWDSFRATPATQVSADMLQEKNGPNYMDMNPIPSRKSVQQFRFQPEYMPTTTVPPKENSTNPYLQRLDAAGSDSRNIVRELRGAVTEDNRERDVEANKRLTERQFIDRYMPAKMAADINSLEAYELLRPKNYADTQ